MDAQKGTQANPGNQLVKYLVTGLMRHRADHVASYQFHLECETRRVFLRQFDLDRLCILGRFQGSQQVFRSQVQVDLVIFLR